MRPKALIANWKMHGSRALIDDFCNYAAASSHQNIICPPAPLLGYAITQWQGLAMHLGVQNIHQHAAGAHTGEISAAIAKDAGASHCIIGHSERRQDFGETDAIVSQKIEQANQQQLCTVVCVGESLQQRQQSSHNAFVAAQLHAIAPCLRDDAMIAYEPIWAIGTGKTASPEQANAMHQHIRAVLGEYSLNIAVLYGGSVNPENAAALFGCSDIDGALVGRSSLEYNSWQRLNDLLAAS